MFEMIMVTDNTERKSQMLPELFGVHMVTPMPMAFSELLSTLPMQMASVPTSRLMNQELPPNKQLILSFPLRVHLEPLSKQLQHPNQLQKKHQKKLSKNKANQWSEDRLMIDLIVHHHLRHQSQLSLLTFTEQLYLYPRLQPHLHPHHQFQPHLLPRPHLLLHHHQLKLKRKDNNQID